MHNVILGYDDIRERTAEVLHPRPQVKFRPEDIHVIHGALIRLLQFKFLEKEVDLKRG